MVAANRRRSLTEALAVFGGDDEGLDHLSADVVAVEEVQLIQPEVVAAQVGIRRGVRVATQVTEVLHEHEGRILLLLFEGGVRGYVQQHRGARFARRIELGYQRFFFRLRRYNSGV